MEIKKSDLKTALEIVKPGLATKESIEQTTSVAFIEKRVVTYNDEISISHPIPGLGITGAIQAPELYALLGKLKQEVIKIEVKETEIILKSGRAKAGLVLQSEIKLPVDGEIAEKGKWKTLPENFNKQLLFSIGACGTDMTKPLMTCANIAESVIQGSDSFKIIQTELSDKMPVKPFLLPANSAAKLVRLKPVKIAAGKGWVHFKTKENTVISCRIFEDKYPDISKHLKCKGESLTLPDNLLEVLEKASVFAKREQAIMEIVEISLSGTKLIVHSESEGGWFEEDIKIKKIGKTINFKIPPYLLQDILKQTLKCTVGKGKLKFKGDDWVYVATLKE
jgi:DNA polymerase III sliding clamp (beta) subunit (PCNA family)